MPLAVFDAGDDPETLARELGDLDWERLAVLVRLRSGRCFSADPERQPRTGRPRRHGRKFACADPTSWWTPTDEHVEEHPQYGQVHVHRFDLEHTYRFCKQTLNRTTPRVRHPEQADRRTWLVLLAYTQLRLARRAIDDRRLPWERPQRPHRRALTPARVRQAFPQLLVTLGTPADAPKPCGRSPGRPRGRRPGPAPRYPAIKKAA